MDYSSLMKELEQASLFDLWRLSTAIGRVLEDPERIKAIRRQLRPGQTVRYFEADENREITATVLEIKRTRALVRNDHDGKRWNIPFYMINLDGVDTAIKSSGDRRKVNRSGLRVGDRVGYLSRDNVECYGEIIKLNPKTATVRLTDGAKWRVPYSMLFSVIDGQEGDDGMGLLIEAD